jgi:copper(I)-binding protein
LEHAVIRSRWAGGPGRLVPARRLVLAAAAAAALIPAVAGCEAGTNAPTLSFHYPTDAAGTAVGSLSIRNVFVLGAPIGRKLAAGQSASVFLSLVNTGTPDKLVSISAPGTATSVTLPGSGIPVVNGHPVYYSGPQPQVVLHGLTRPLLSGSDVRLVLTFQKAGPIVLDVPVMPRALQYATLAPPPATVSPAAAGHGAAAAATPSPGASAAPAATPSPSAS